ncbi:hydroxyethylthiazole kinase [Brevibacterium sp. GP-SGM9]|uniref:hydroxyethylthiazole kinase n=1 Tax=Brevibacterium sp. GP-SGM9 TaxID=3376990 RepID=UPI0039A67FB6
MVDFDLRSEFGSLGDLPGSLRSAHERLRAGNPLIQCITNTVVQQFSANVLLAIGASPAMLDHDADAAQFTRVSSGLLVNFGTATNQQFLAADAATEAALDDGTPWVLDPVSIGAVDFRTTRIHRAAKSGPTAIRGNASEIAALAGAGAGGRGVESTDEVDAVVPAAAELARSTGAVVAVSGPRDAVVAHIDGVDHVARIAGGHDFMPLVIGTGCSLGAVTAAYLAGVEKAGAGQADAAAKFTAVIAAHAHFKVAGQAAAVGANGPGSYSVNFLDALYATTAEQIAEAAVEIGTVAPDSAGTAAESEAADAAGTAADRGPQS